MIRSLTGLILAVCFLAVASNASGEDVKIDRKAMVTGPRKAMVNGAPEQPAPQSPQGNRAGNGGGAFAHSPYRTHHHHSYHVPHYYGYGYRSYGYRSSYYRSYPRYYGGYGYGGPVFVPAGRIFGPAAAMRFMYGR